MRLVNKAKGSFDYMAICDWVPPFSMVSKNDCFGTHSKTLTNYKNEDFKLMTKPKYNTIKRSWNKMQKLCPVASYNSP